MKAKPNALLALALGLFVANSASAETFDVHWGDTLNEPNGHYRLPQDLTGVGTAITITADHVVLDLNGHSITGDGLNVSTPILASTGILVENASHVQIKKAPSPAFPTRSGWRRCRTLGEEYRSR